jgi:hypothetical protein
VSNEESLAPAELATFARTLDAAGATPAAGAATPLERGYRSDWLEFPLPLPAFTSAVSDHLEQRDYSRYTVLFDLEKRLCRMGAAGIPAAGDPEAAVWLTRDGERRVVKRLIAFLAARHSGPFREDGELPDGVQVGWSWYDAIASIAGGARTFDKGHIVDRLHVSFGATEEEAQRSMAQSYFFTNVVPQTPLFNERDPKTGWPHIERYVMALSKLGARVVHWTGPIFDDATDPLVTVSDVAPDGIQIPCRYWKIVAAQRLDAPSTNIACAFILDDTARVQKTVAAINAASISPVVAETAPAPLPDPRLGAKAATVYWTTLGDIGKHAGFGVSAFDPFARPLDAAGAVRSTASVLRATVHSVSA